MKLKESIGTDLKSAMSTEMGKLSTIASGGIDAAVAANEFKNEIPEDNKKVKIIKKPMKKGVTNKLMSKTKINKPIGKLTTGLPIMGEDGETSESTGSGSAGGFEGPLFSSADRFVNKPKKIETKEATGSGSSGSYETPAAWAKSSSKKNLRGAAKTQIPGGKFVEVKKKCQKFPYCNQGDIKALNIFENETFKKVIKNIGEKHGISENVIKSILSYEYYNVK